MAQPIDGTVSAASQFLLDESPDLFQPDVYKDPQLQHIKARNPRLGFTDKVDAAINQLSPLVNYGDRVNLHAARNTSTKVDVPDEVLLEGLPEEFQVAILSEKSTHGSTAALVLSDQIKDDIKNNTIMDSLDWYAQLGYSAVGFLSDPTTYIAAGGAIKAGAGLSSVASKAGSTLGVNMPRTAGVLTEWGTVGAIESSVLNAPRLGGDHTYKVENYVTDVMVDALLGAGLTYGLTKAVSKGQQYAEQVRGREDATAERMQMMERELETANNVVEPSDFDVESTLATTKPTLADVEAKVPSGRLTSDPRVKVDNDTQWLAAQVETYGSVIQKLNKFNRYVNMQDVQGHIALRQPTAENLLDLGKQLKRKLEQVTAVRDSQAGPVATVKPVPLQQLVKAKGARTTQSMAAVFKQMDKDVEQAASSALTRLADVEKRISGLGNSAFKKQFDYGLKQLNAKVSKKLDVTEAKQVAQEIEQFAKDWTSISSPRNGAKASVDLLGQMSSTINKIAQQRAGLREKRSAVAQRVKIESTGYSAEQSVPHTGNWADNVTPEIRWSFEMDAVTAKLDAQALRAELTKQANSNWRKAYSAAVNAIESKASGSQALKELLSKAPEPIRGGSKAPELGIMAAANMRIGTPDDIAVVVNSIRQGKVAETDIQAAVEELKLVEPDLTVGVTDYMNTADTPVANARRESKEYADTEASVGARLLKASHHSMSDMVSAYHASGEHQVYKGILQPSNVKQVAARAITQWGGVTQDLATRFIESKSPTINWVGTHLTEMGRGYGGDVMRKHTAGVIREAEYIKSISMIMPDYDKAVKAYAASQGSGKVGEMMAAVSVGGRNKLQDEFARSFMKYMNDLRMGRQVDNPEMAKFADKWNAYMRHNYNMLQKNNISGFTGDNQRNAYVPQVWQVKHAQRLIRETPDKVHELLTKATGSEDKADKLIEWLDKQDALEYDGYVATNDARSIERMNVDWSVEVDGLSVLDLLETDTRKLSTSYSNRVAGWVSVSKASQGKVRSYTDINALKLMAWQESKSSKDVELIEDTIDMLFGRQVRGGLPDYARSIKAATVLTRLGGLGSAQLIESGTVATRAIMESTGDPKFMKKLVDGMSPKETAQDLLEIQKMTGNDWDYHLINAEAEYYTEYDLADTGKLQNSVDKAVDVATGGHFKQLAGRAFGHVTGYNQVRRFQSAMVQRSFAMQVARMFKYGESKLSVERAADYGLTDTQGNNSKMKANIEEHVEFDADGYPTKYNFDKWDAEAKDTFMYSLQRAEATELMRPLVGEMPAWFNKPWMQMLMQFRTMPLVAQNKALGRSIAFADKEAVVQLALNTMTAGLVRYGKYAGLAALAAGTGANFEEEYQRKVDQAGRDAILGGAVDRYITQGGMYSDMYALTMIGGSASTPQQYLERAMQQVPAMGLIKDYAMGAYAISEQDGDKALRHVTGVIPLNNTLAFEAAEAVITETIGE